MSDKTHENERNQAGKPNLASITIIGSVIKDVLRDILLFGVDFPAELPNSQPDFQSAQRPAPSKFASSISKINTENQATY